MLSESVQVWSRKCQGLDLGGAHFEVVCVGLHQIIIFIME